jgi:hypothetical protein
LQPAGVKIPGRTAIPAGRYRIELAPMPTLGKPGQLYVHLVDVPDFVGIFAHGGNTPADVRGCIAVARYFKAANWIYGSLAAELAARVAKAGGTGYWDVMNGPEVQAYAKTFDLMA